MAIQELKQPNGSILYKVVRSVGGKLKQKYHRRKQDAELDDFGFRFAQLDAQKENKFKHKRKTLSSTSDTAISGIKMRYVFDTTKRNGKTFVSCTPCFCVSSSHKNVKFTKCFNINKKLKADKNSTSFNRYEKAWAQAIEFLCKKREATVKEKDHLLSLEPPIIEMWAVIHKFYEEKRKERIDLNKLPYELIAKHGFNVLEKEIRPVKDKR